MSRVTFVFSHPLADRVWGRAQERLGALGHDVVAVSQSAPLDWETFAQARIAGAEIAWIEIGRASPGFAPVIDAARHAALAVAAGLEARAALGESGPAARARVAPYLRAGTEEDLVNATLALLHQAGLGEAPPPPSDAPTLGLHHPDAMAPRGEIAAFLAWAGARAAPDAAIVALLFDRTAWLNDDLDAIDALIGAAEAAGLVPFPLYCASELARGWGDGDHPLARALDAAGPGLAAIWNAAGLHGALIDADPFARHRVPVIQILRDWSHDESGWRADPRGLGAVSLVFGLTRPEMLGTVDPTLVTVTERGAAAERRARPVADQIARLAARTVALIRLARTPNAEKRLAILLHNPPCKGMEATIGTAPGLDALESTVRLLHRLGAEGYDVGTPPEDGAALLALIRDRRAVQEFRWTGAAEIVASGGALALIDEAAYRADFDRLPGAVRTAIDAAWGVWPGEAMVHPGPDGAPALVVSGLRFGTVLVMTEPKRGCHRARCDGEVCRILHDPLIPPPHHWFATFWYLGRTVDALVTVGSESPIDFLPGKRTALSETCYPTVTLGDLPVIQAVLVSASAETLMARRRGRAVTVGHLGAPLARIDAASAGWDALEEVHREYQAATGARRAELERQLALALGDLGLFAPDAGGELGAAIDALPRRLRRLRARCVTQAPHVLGRVPDAPTAALYLAEARGPLGRAIDEAAVRDGLSATGGELDTLVGALSGRFVAPGPGGHLSRGRTELLPTGRNPFGTDLRRLPTEAAWAVGARMGEKLIAAWAADGGAGLPDTIGLSLWSSDAFQAEGETLAQALWLLGCRPLRDAKGQVDHVEAIPLDDLLTTDETGQRVPRPRFDVVVQISGVVRDTLPGLVGLIDQAVALVAALDEPPERNRLRARVEERLAVLTAELGAGSPLAARLARARVFGPPEGGYGGGLGLALDASAWEGDADLAEIVVNHAGHAYGAEGAALETSARMIAEYAAVLSRTDLWCQRQAGPAGDLLATSCGVEGAGAAAVARRGLGGGAMRLFWSDAETNAEGEVRTLRDELADSLALSLLDPGWLARTKQQGYAGGQAVSDRVNRLFGWSAATHLVSRAQFDAVHDRLIGDAATRDWLRTQAPHAMDEILRRLAEARARGLWAADPTRSAALEAAILALDGDEEERRGGHAGDTQGGEVVVRARADVPGWEVLHRVR